MKENETTKRQRGGMQGRKNERRKDIVESEKSKERLKRKKTNKEKN